MVKQGFVLILLMFSYTIIASAQNKKTDSTQLKEVVIKAYLSSKPILSLPTSVSFLGQNELKNQPQTALVQAVNTLPGVRMEERSPGSYRFSIRGSLLRSPFGIRNVKMYMGDFPLTDAGGNTYLNLIDPASISGMEILKGPDGSLFGANSGGVVVIHPQTADSVISADVSAGSYGLFKEHTKFTLGKGTLQVPVFQGYQYSGGYRQNSSLNRFYLQAAPQWNYAENKQFKGFLFFSDLKYQTPGGLTQAQFDANPQQARPGTNAVPGPINQKAGIRNKTFYGGLSHDAQFGRIHHVIAVFGSNTDFANPFLTNYEVHQEQNFGLRTYAGMNGGDKAKLKWEVNAGLEFQQSQNQIANYGNRGGTRDTLQAADKILSRQHFYFSQITLSHQKWILESAVSLNFYDYRFRRPNMAEVTNYTPGQINFDPQLMPRFSLSYETTKNFAWRATISRGYSPPATAEIRSSDNVINTTLQPEKGWNYETGIRLYSNRKRFTLDGSIYYYRLSQAIVRRLNDMGNEFFVNAGGTHQPGIEIAATGWLIEQKNTGFIRGLQVQHAATITRYRFSNYINGTNNYSANRLTGTPGPTLITGMYILAPQRLSLFIQHNYTGKIPLNDANTVFARPHQLLYGKISYGFKLKTVSGEIYAAVDNAFNQTYSLGNDLNAFGGRYFNAAAKRNWLGGLRVGF